MKKVTTIFAGSVCFAAKMAATKGFLLEKK